MKRLYLIRHGESEFNVLSLHQHPNVPLTESGQKQSTTIGERFKKIPVDCIISSPHLRAKHTSEIINQHLNKPLEFSPLLKEIKLPAEIEGKSRKDQKIIDIKQLMRERINEDWHYADEENFFDLKIRIGEFIKYLDSLDYENILAVSHGGVIRFIVCYLIYGDTLSSDTFLSFKDHTEVSNTGLTVCEERNNHWTLVTWNDLAHLGEELSFLRRQESN